MTIREMYNNIGEHVQHISIRLVGEDGDTSANRTEDGVWATTGKPKCSRCRERFDDGEEAVIAVEVEESTLPGCAGKPGCSEKRVYHVECCPPEILHPKL